MENSTQISCGELSRAFVYGESPDYQIAFDSLLSAITPIEFPKDVPFVSYGDSSSTCFYSSMPYMAYYKAKDELPKYINSEEDEKKLRCIDFNFVKIMRLKKEIKALPWYQVRKIFQLWRKLRKFATRQIDVKTAFAYLNYRAKQSKLNLKALHDEFKAYAENSYGLANFLGV